MSNLTVEEWAKECFQRGHHAIYTPQSFLCLACVRAYVEQEKAAYRQQLVRVLRAGTFCRICVVIIHSDGRVEHEQDCPVRLVAEST